MAGARPVPIASLALAVLVTVGAACARPAEEDLFGVVLEVESRQEFVYREDFRERLHRVLEESCAHVGIDTARLYGMRLRIVDGGIRCGGYEAARGCALEDGSEISVSTLAWITTSPPVSCVEDTPLPHEILHLRIGDGAHDDPRWSSAEYWDPLRRSLARPGCSRDAATLLW
jgi:hypothetical protein